MLIYYVVEKEADGLFFGGHRMDTDNFFPLAFQVLLSLAPLLQRIRVDHFQFSLQ